MLRIFRLDKKILHIGFGIEEEASEVLHLEHSLCGAGSGTVGAVNQKQLESLEM